ncbi:MAG: NADPH-dependent 7-cyano-7-deazaguanine reductase QueF, partial [Gammaproteobacteria bacterium]
RKNLGITAHTALPFQGVDYWNAYEVSWLNPKGKPEVGLLELAVPAVSPFIVESKSLKLYLNSFNQHRFRDNDQVADTIKSDIEKILTTSIELRLYTGVESKPNFEISPLSGECIDHLDIEVPGFAHDQSVLISDLKNKTSETLCSHLLRSNCPVTSQPDWASVLIRYHGPKINRESLLKYIISYRTHNEFHEQCVERIFVDLLACCKPDKLTVYARYTRRGGIDINPFRSNFESPCGNQRLLRQ